MTRTRSPSTAFSSTAFSCAATAGLGALLLTVTACGSSTTDAKQSATTVADQTTAASSSMSTSAPTSSATTASASTTSSATSTGPTMTASTKAQAGTSSQTPHPTATKTATKQASGANLPAGAFPGAGGPIPAGAQPIPLSGGSAMLQSPLGNNVCEFLDSGAFCSTTKKSGPNPYAGGADAGFLTVDLSKNPPTILGRGTTTAEWMGSLKLAYGQSAYWKNYVCGSSSSGLTCWNTGTGRGALINSSGITVF